MDSRAIARTIKKLLPGEPVEVVWRDACTMASRWMDLKDAQGLALSVIVTRGTFVGAEDGSVRIALDAGLHDDGSLGDFHGVGVVDRGAIVEIAALRRKGRTRK